ncbi:hypothetical protein L3X38_040720 [Prunus dulcis]|uniref:Uncharacterized protein n=1 Tax=Prunus dulcis TaxID=3755 RepID=A0AAD4VB44_PRUDU|nr:hypothetical protein L3X38_040720 [Prunus dulcis]
MKVDDEQFPPPVINMVEPYFQPEEARQRRALWPEVRSSGAEKGSTGERLLEYWAEDSVLLNSPINLIEFQHESDDGDVLTIDDLDTAPIEMEDSHPESEKKFNIFSKQALSTPARYVEWLANLVPVLKNTVALMVCPDYRHLNLETPKDEYPIHYNYAITRESMVPF